MTSDSSFIGRNRASTDRIRTLAASLSDQDLGHPVGEHWTVAITLAHLAFWDRRVLNLLEAAEMDGQFPVREIDIAVNDISLPLWAAIPPRAAAGLALETAQALDERLANLPPALLEQLQARNERWVVRALHRNGHLDEVDAALKKKPHM